MIFFPVSGRFPSMQKILVCATGLWLFVAPAHVWGQVPAPPPASAAGSSQSIDEIRRDYRMHSGPLYLKPAFLLKELGVDTNVFNAAGRQKSDFTFTVTPQADLAIPLARRGLVKATLGTDLVYYATYDSERSVD